MSHPAGILSHLRTPPPAVPYLPSHRKAIFSGVQAQILGLVMFLSSLPPNSQQVLPALPLSLYVENQRVSHHLPCICLLHVAVIPHLAVQEPPQPHPPCLPALVPQSLLLPPPQPGDPSHCPGFSRFHLAQSQVPSRPAQPSTACSWLPAASCPPLSLPSLAVTCPFLEHTRHAPVPWPLNLTCLPSSSTVRALISSFSSSPPVSPHRAASLPPTQAWGAHPRTWAHSSP